MKCMVRERRKKEREREREKEREREREKKRGGSCCKEVSKDKKKKIY